MTQHDDRRTTMPETAPEYLLWLDFETTGLTHADPIEVACVLTRADDFTEIGSYETLVTTDLPQWSWDALEMHTATGLVNDWVSARGHGRLFTSVEAQGEIIAMLQDAAVETVTLAGSGVGTFDLPIIRSHMNRLFQMLTYHVHDVGVLRRAYRRATGTDLTPRNEPAHRAMADVRQSIDEGRAFASLFRDYEAGA